MLVVLLRDGKARFFEILHDDIWLFGGILPRILAGALIGSLLTLLLPRDKVSRAIGADSGLLGLFVATLFGALLPGGPFTIYPIASALLMMGADVGATIAFVTSWTLIGYARPIVWEMPIMGVEFTLWRILYCLPLPILAGLLGRYVVRLRPSWGRM